MRALAFEADFVDGAERMAQPGTDFQDAVHRRLSMGQEMYGDKWAGMDVGRLLREIREEGLDLATWSALTAQHSHLDGLSDDDRQRATLLLQEIAAHGAKVDALVKQLRDDLL